MKLRVFVGGLILVGVFVQPAIASEMAGLFLSQSDRERISELRKDNKSQWRGSVEALMRRAKSAAATFADPFQMDDLSSIRFGWCGGKGKPGTLSSLTDKLDRETGMARDLALAYSISGYKPFARNAERFLLAWERKGQLVNMYDFNIDFGNGSFDGMTSDGFCGDRPWNFALDVMWQTYGLINASDTYLLLKQGGYEFKNEELVRSWIRELSEAVNSSFHAWTRWADEHRGASSYVRYRSDNHLSWCLAGLMAAGIALDDGDLIAYVLEGKQWKDSKAGVYENPSSLKAIIDLAIEGDGENRGRLYEEKIKRKPPVGYSFFHLWPMTLVAVMADRHGIEDVWEFKGEDGAGLKEAYERYAEYILERRDSPRQEQEGSRNGYAWLYEIASSVWSDEASFAEARDTGNRTKYIRQSVGPVRLLFSSD